MAQREDRGTIPGQPESFSGKVLLAGTGFMVTAALWGLLGFVQAVWQHSDIAIFDLALAVLHLAAGAAILRRVRYAWAAGLILAAIAIGGTVINDYYLAVVADGVSALLLFFSHAELSHTTPHAPGDRG